MEVREPSAKYLAKDAFKQTEVGLVPSDWSVARLGDLFQIGSSKRIFQREWRTEGVPFYRAREIAVLGEVGVIDNELFIDEKRYDELKRANGVPSPGDMLVTGVGTLGKVYVVPDERAFYFKDGNIIWFKIKGAVCSAFLRQLYLTRTVIRQIFDTSSGTTVGTYTISCAKSTVIPLPHKDEQEAIAEVLHDADALIESLEQLLAKKRHIKQGAMQELLTGQRRLPGFAREWEAKRLGDVAEMASGGTPPSSNSSYYDGAVPWVAIADITKAGKYIETTERNLSAAGLANCAAKMFPIGTVLYAMYASLGECSIANAPMSSSQAILGIQTMPALDNEFLYYFLQSIRPVVKGMGQQGTQANLNKGMVRDFQLNLPPLDEQTAIATLLSDMDAEIAALETKLAKARHLKQGMMQELLTGRIRLVQPKAEVIPFPEQTASAPNKSRPHNRQIEEAVMLGVLAKAFGSEHHPLARVRRTKLLYLLHRFTEGVAEGYLKKAAGPYNPKTRYQGAEGIALKNAYVCAHHNGTYEGFVAGNKVAEAEAYFDKWYEPGVRAWLERFHYTKTDELELLATVDMAVQDLRREGKPVSLDTVKQVIRSDREWKAKLDKPIFSDANIERAIAECHNLFGD